jgi:hypothetical protein
MTALRGHHPRPAVPQNPAPLPLPAEGQPRQRQWSQDALLKHQEQDDQHSGAHTHQSRPFGASSRRPRCTLWSVTRPGNHHPLCPACAAFPARLPLPPDTRKRPAPPTRRPPAPPPPPVFLSVFKWELRKGWRELLRAFTSAFGPEDNVQLLVLARPFMGSGTDFAGGGGGWGWRVGQWAAPCAGLSCLFDLPWPGRGIAPAPHACCKGALRAVVLYCPPDPGSTADPSTQMNPQFSVPHPCPSPDAVHPPPPPLPPGLIRRWAAEELAATTPEDLAALPRIFVSGQHVDEPTFVRVYKSVDALVIPTHGEGWGRPQMEVGRSAAPRRGTALHGASSKTSLVPRASRWLRHPRVGAGRRQRRQRLPSIPPTRHTRHVACCPAPRFQRLPRSRPAPPGHVHGPARDLHQLERPDRVHV